MNTDNVYKQLQLDEGIKYEIYRDHLGYPTFGVGHLVTKQNTMLLYYLLLVDFFFCSFLIIYK